MDEIGLGVADPTGAYVEVEGGGYARAASGTTVSFGVATATWGVVRAVGLVREGGAPEWRQLAAPALVQAGDRVVYDGAEERLVFRPVAPVLAPTHTAPTLTARRYDPIVRG